MLIKRIFFCCLLSSQWCTQAQIPLTATHIPQQSLTTLSSSSDTLTKALTNKPSSPQRTVTITNNIQPAMLIKKHWTGKKTPDKFAISIDGKQVEPGKTITATLSDNTLKCNFNYSFMNGYRTGENQVTFEVPEKNDVLDLTFSWENDFRIIIDKATAKEKIAIGS